MFVFWRLTLNDYMITIVVRKRLIMKKMVLFLCGGLMAILLYLVMIGAYCRLSDDPIIFFASIVISLIVAVAVSFAVWWLSGKGMDSFTVFTVSIIYFLALILLAVFGPTFIDRSISYHIAFYAADEGEVNIEEIRDEFSYEIFDKRIHDAVVTGFIEESETDGVYVPTKKAYFMNDVLKPIGKLTNSLDTYEEMRREVHEN
jgi:uncharacterized protein YacL